MGFSVHLDAHKKKVLYFDDSVEYDITDGGVLRISVPGRDDVDVFAPHAWHHIFDRPIHLEDEDEDDDSDTDDDDEGIGSLK
ncbi:hypothetical protein [Smaragdicoccus niigatensis]|uniref:hypothetical protein n=1 Tax=Smaragdicoccus niigatensis TaxID=359359 RepID=UPI00036B665D|nr:hypothetical protein [Smaragdicoccus niigatensis]